MNLYRLWQGKLPLDRAFWSYAVIGGIGVNLVTSFCFLIFLSLDMPVAAFITGYVVSLPYNLLATIGVCRAAARDGQQAEDDQQIARAKLYPLITIAGMLLLSIT